MEATPHCLRSLQLTNIRGEDTDGMDRQWGIYGKPDKVTWQTIRIPGAYLFLPLSPFILHQNMHFVSKVTRI
jgi:hypothetical protein